MIPSIFTRTGAAGKEHHVYHIASEFSPPTSPLQLPHIPGGSHTDSHVRNINMKHI